MSNDLDKVIACLKFLGLHPSMYVYRWRFLTQKIAFLAKALGMDIGYDFTVYVAGPYSRELNCDYYPDEIKTKMDALQTDYVLTPSDLLVLERIRNCRGLLENQSLMEAASTAIFFMYSLYKGISSLWITMEKRDVWIFSGAMSDKSFSF